MKGIRNRRLRAPLLLLAWGGAQAAVDAIGGKGGAAVAAAVVAIPVAAGWYAWGGRDSDYGALIGDRADERQALIRTRARALSGTAMYAAAVISGVVVIAVRGIGHWSSYWPLRLVAAVGTVTYLWGGRACGFGRLIGDRADERQALIRTRARALAATAMAAAAVIGVLVEVALGDTTRSYWPFSLVAVIGAVSYWAGLRRHGARGEDDPGPGDDSEQRAPEPILTWWGGNRRVTS
jgi:hypothetical protein